MSALRRASARIAILAASRSISAAGSRGIGRRAFSSAANAAGVLPSSRTSFTADRSREVLVSRSRSRKISRSATMSAGSVKFIAGINMFPCVR